MPHGRQAPKDHRRQGLTCLGSGPSLRLSSGPAAFPSTVNYQVVRNFRPVIDQNEKLLDLCRPAHFSENIVFIGKNGAPGVIRTLDLVLRRHTLYPAELRARCAVH